MLITVTSIKPISRVREDLRRACADHKFGVLGVHDLQEKLREKGVDYPHPCVVFEVCNPQQARRVLEANPDVATALPCRIALTEAQGGGTRLATLKPTGLIDLFGSPELRAVAAEVEETLAAIMRDAAR